MSEPDIPAYISRKRAARQLDMSRDTFVNYVRKGVLPPPKRRGKLTRWKWSEISAVLDDGNFSVIQSAEDPYDRGVERAKAPMLELPPACVGSSPKGVSISIFSAAAIRLWRVPALPSRRSA